MRSWCLLVIWQELWQTCTPRHNRGCRNLIKTVSAEMQYSNSSTKLGAVTSEGNARHLLSSCQAMKRKPVCCQWIGKPSRNSKIICVYTPELFLFLMRDLWFALWCCWRVEHSGMLMMHAVVQLVEALPYKPEGREFDSKWGNFSLT
jgi:hypothetical protein